MRKYFGDEPVFVAKRIRAEGTVIIPAIRGREFPRICYKPRRDIVSLTFCFNLAFFSLFGELLGEYHVSLGLPFSFIRKIIISFAYYAYNILPTHLFPFLFLSLSCLFILQRSHYNLFYNHSFILKAGHHGYFPSIS